MSNLYYRYFLEEYRPRYVVISKTKKKRYIAIPISAPTFPIHIGREDNNNTDEVNNDDPSDIVGNKNDTTSSSHSSSNCCGVRGQHDNNNAVFLGLQRMRRQIKEQFVIGSLEILSKPQRQDDTPQSYTIITKAATRSTLTTTVSVSLSSTTSIVEEEATSAAAAGIVGRVANGSEKEQQQQQQQQPTSKKTLPSSLPLAASPTTLLAPRIEKFEDAVWPLPKSLDDDDDDDDDHNTANAKTNDNNNNQKKKNDGADELFLSFFQCCRSVI